MTTTLPVYDPSRALYEDYSTFFMEHHGQYFLFPTMEGMIEIKANWLHLNIVLCMPLIRRGQPISSKRHMMLSGIYDSSSHAEVEDRIVRSLEDAGYKREEIEHDIVMTANTALNLCYTHLPAYVRAMDLGKIGRTILQSRAKAACSVDYGDVDDLNIKRMEDAFNEQAQKMYELMVSDELPYNVFRAPLLCKAIKKDQFLQFVLSGGPRTGTDEHMTLRPVVGSFLSGMRDIKDLAIESQAAAKSTHYNKSYISDAQYRSRKQHIQNSSIGHLYYGNQADCGSTVYMDYHITQKDVMNYIGKWILGNDGHLWELTEERFPEVIGKTVWMRDPITCLHRDGYCEVCGGTITKSFSRNGNVGFLSNVKTGSPITQLLLSAKHHQSTKALPYVVPEPMQPYLLADGSNVFIHTQIFDRIGEFALGFAPKDISKINDLRYITDDSAINISHFTDVKTICVGRVQPDGFIKQISKKIPMKSDSGTFPHLSPEVLTIIREYPEDFVLQDKTYWLKLKRVDVTSPIMECTVINKSIRQYVRKFTDLVTKDPGRYTSIREFMHDLTTLVWPLVPTHITHMSVLARSCLVTSKKDFHVPVVTDPDKVMFSNLGKNIPMRSIGGLFAFERIDTAMNNIVTYVTPKQHGPFDEFMGYTDQIEKYRNYPSGCDTLIEEPIE